MDRSAVIGRGRGMLLIEAVVVLTVVCVLTAIVLGAIGVAQRKSRDTDRITDLNAIRKALGIYFHERGTFPQGEGFLLGYPATGSLCQEGWSHRCVGRPVMLYVPRGRARTSRNCAIGDDEYVYSQRAAGRDYVIRFCFEGDIGGWSGGLHEADQYGIH